MNLFEVLWGVERTCVAGIRVKAKKNTTLNDFRPNLLNSMPAILFVRLSYMQLASALKTLHSNKMTSD